MKPMTFTTLSVAGLNVSRGEGDIGDFARYYIPDAHPNELGYGIIVYVKGKFVRFDEDNPADRLELEAGDTNHKVGFRKAGNFRLEATQDGTVHYCVWHESKQLRAKYRKVELAAVAAGPMLRGEIGIVSAGSLLVGTKEFAMDSMFVAASGDVTVTGGASGGTVHVFSL